MCGTPEGIAVGITRCGIDSVVRDAECGTPEGIAVGITRRACEGRDSDQLVLNARRHRSRHHFDNATTIIRPTGCGTPEGIAVGITTKNVSGLFQVALCGTPEGIAVGITANLSDRRARASLACGTPEGIAVGITRGYQ